MNRIIQQRVRCLCLSYAASGAIGPGIRPGSILCIDAALKYLATPRSGRTEKVMATLRMRPCVGNSASGRESDLYQIAPVDAICIRLAVFKGPGRLIGKHDALQQ